jgi:predicted RNA binding protein YcfA (HicA-like mRNA interferase family)
MKEDAEIMKFREIEAIIKKDGWQYAYAAGSHYYYIYPTKPGKVLIPFHHW